MELLGVDIVGGQPEQVVILPHRTFHPLVAALATGAFFLFFLFKLYWLTPVALAAVIVVFLAWTRDTALSGDMELLAIGHGQALPWHLQAERPPSWWAMVFTIVADMTAYVSLLFGSLFLWVSAPNWPPQQSLEIGTATPFAALAALGTVALAGRMAAVAGRRRSGWLALAILAHAVAGAIFLWLAASVAPDPRSHAAAASVFVILLYAALHNGVGIVFAAYGIWRIRKGFVSKRRNLDLRLGEIWHGYSALLGAISAFFPVLLAGLISGGPP